MMWVIHIGYRKDVFIDTPLGIHPTDPEINYPTLARTIPDCED